MKIFLFNNFSRFYRQAWFYIDTCEEIEIVNSEIYLHQKSIGKRLKINFNSSDYYFIPLIYHDFPIESSKFDAYSWTLYVFRYSKFDIMIFSK